MAPVDIYSPASLLPGGLFISHILLATYLSVIVARTIYRSYLVLPPSSATRHREPSRKSHVRLFTLLTLVSLSLAGIYSYKFSSLSYRIWASERGLELPESIFGHKGALRGGRLQLFRWLYETTYYRDTLEIVAEKTRSLWWGQQANLGLVSWSLYLAIEGQRRKIPHLWVFLALAQLVSLSYAQNLFFLAVLLTPVPLPENVKDLTRTSMPITSTRYSRLMKKFMPPRPEGFVASQYVYITLLVLTYATVFLIPWTSNTPVFMIISIASRSLPFLFLALPYITPERWGTVSTHPHSAHSTHTKLFRTISTISALFHFKSTVTALFYNAPDSYYHRHSLIHPFRKEHRSALNRGTTAVGRIFGAIGEHPAVGAVGWDVVLSGLSLGVWAAVRGLEPKEMLNASTAFVRHTKEAADEVVNSTKVIISKAEETIDPNTPPRRRVGRPKKYEDSPPHESPKTTQTIPGPNASKRRGRPRKTPPDEDADDTTYRPPRGEQIEEGDEDVEDDWEAAALTWGLIAVGGLGVGSSGVYGAEVVAR